MDGVVDVDVDEVVVLELDVEDFCVEVLELDVEVEDTFVEVVELEVDVEVEDTFVELLELNVEVEDTFVEVVELEVDVEVEDAFAELLELNVEDTFVEILEVLCSELLVVDGSGVELLITELELVREALEVEVTDFDVVLEIVPLLLLPTTVSVEDLLVIDVDGFSVEVLKVDVVLVAFD